MELVAFGLLPTSRPASCDVVEVTGTKTYSLRNARSPSTMEGMTALHVAVQPGRADLAPHLLKKGANPEIADSNGRKAIDLVLDVRAGNPTASVDPAAGAAEVGAVSSG